ncbi:MAG: hypothetical protein QW465_00940 [Candidatus Anstonellales archaeon]
MKLGKYVILKDKQFYTVDMRLIGNAVEITRELANTYNLLHIRDRDLERGVIKNLDIYDKLTYYINVQVEIHRELLELERLLEFQVRLVAIPGIASRYSLYKAIMIDRYDQLVDNIRDVIISDPALIDGLLGKYRVMTLGFRDRRVFLAIDM